MRAAAALLSVVVLAVAGVTAIRLTPEANGDLITDLPSAPSVPFSMFSGYITVDPASQRRLFYWFVTSARNASDPLVLWLNGGPGCSSLGGLLTENGPFFAIQGGLEINPNSWNNVANMIYLESPAGVGFSYSENKQDYTVGDARTANDTYAFMQGFLERYPQYRGNDFYVSGESYGGHYVPNAALRVVQGNLNAAPQLKINIKGFLVGNAWTVAPVDNAGCITDWYQHALISESTATGALLNCDFAVIGPLTKAQVSNAEIAEALIRKEQVMRAANKAASTMPATYDPTVCNAYLNAAYAERGNINIYQIFEPLCQAHSASGERLLQMLAETETHFGMLARRFTAEGDAPIASPCIDGYTSTYLNRKDVQQAIHTDPTQMPTWYECSPVLNYSYTDLLSSMIPVYDQLLQVPNFRILVYSGDVDGIVPFPGTRNWISSFLSLKETRKWTPYMVNGNVGGYVTQYNNGWFNFATVRGAGHMVPGTQPERALYLFSNFLKGRVQ